MIPMKPPVSLRAGAGTRPYTLITLDSLTMPTNPPVSLRAGAGTRPYTLIALDSLRQKPTTPNGKRCLGQRPRRSQASQRAPVT